MLVNNITDSKYNVIREVSINGTLYDSVAIASKALGISTSTIRYRLTTDTDRFEQWFYTGVVNKRDVNGPKNPMYRNGKLIKRKPTAVPVRIYGKDYPSIKAASIDLRMTVPGVRFKLKNNHVGCEYLGGVTVRSTNQKIAIRTQDRSFESISEAYVALGMSRSALVNRLNSESFPKWYRYGCSIKDPEVRDIA